MAELSGLEQGMLWGVIVVAFISLAYAYWLWRDTLRRDKGTPEMQKVWNAIKTGAGAYLQRQLRTMLPILGLLAIVITRYAAPGSRLPRGLHDGRGPVPRFGSDRGTGAQGELGWEES